MGSRVLQEKLCHLKSTCIQAKQLQYNNDIHLRFNDIHINFLHIRRFCISKGGSVPLPSDMRGSTVHINSWNKLLYGGKGRGARKKGEEMEGNLNNVVSVSIIPLLVWSYSSLG